MSTQEVYQAISKHLPELVLPEWESLAPYNQEEVIHAVEHGSCHYQTINVGDIELPSGRLLRYAPAIDGFKEFWKKVGRAKQMELTK